MESFGAAAFVCPRPEHSFTQLSSTLPALKMLGMTTASNVPPAVWAVLISATIVAAVCDVRARRIPNWLNACVFAGGAAWEITTRGWFGLGDGVLACVVLAMPYVLLFLFTPAAGGAADAKLMGAIGMWLGIQSGIQALLWVLLCGAVIGFFYAIAARRGNRLFANLYQMAFGLLGMVSGVCKWEDATNLLPRQERMLPMPYGISILAGVCVTAGLSLLHRGGGLL